jgi:UrcA family protein
MNIITTSASRRLVAATLLGAISSSFIAPSAGAAGLEPLSVTVKYGDLDVSRAQGAITLYSRIRAAAEKVCSPFEAGGVAAKMRFNGCIDKAISDAVKTIHQPELSAFYSAKRGMPQPIRLAFRQSR